MRLPIPYLNPNRNNNRGLNPNPNLSSVINPYWSQLQYKVELQMLSQYLVLSVSLLRTRTSITHTGRNATREYISKRF